jgi:hypothetical protein
MIIDLTGFDDNVGFCDRLWQVSFCANLAYLREDKILLFNEKPANESQSQIADILEIQGFEIKKWGESQGIAEYRLNSFNSAPTIENVKKLKPPDQIMNDESFLSSWISTYKLFSPSQDIKQKIEHIGANKECIGLHIRFTDKVRENPSRYEIHPKELNKVEKRTAYAIRKTLKKNNIRKVYLASDCSKAIQEWREKLESWGVTVLLNNYAVYNEKEFRQTSSEDFLIDLFSLARCRQIVCSVNSGVPITAARIGGLNENEIVWGRYSTRLRSFVRELRKRSKLADLLIDYTRRLKAIILKK